MNLIVLIPVVNLRSGWVVSYDTVSTLPVQLAFSTGGLPAGMIRIPLAFPFSSVVIGALNPIEEFPATPVYLLSGLVHLETSVPSRKG